MQSKKLNISDDILNQFSEFTTSDAVWFNFEKFFQGMERSFSVNKDVSKQNISGHNLVARRIVKDHIHHVGGLRGVVITKELLNSTQCGRHCYHAYLEERQTEKEKKDNGENRKPRGRNGTPEEIKDTTRGIY